MKIVTNVKRIARNIRFILTADLADESKGQTKLWKKQQILEESIEECESLLNKRTELLEVDVNSQVESCLEDLHWDDYCGEAMNNYDLSEHIREATQDYDFESDIEDVIRDCDWSSHIADFLSSTEFKDLLIDSSEDPINEAMQQCVDDFDFADLSESMTESAKECISDMFNKKLSKCLKVLAATLEVKDFEDDDDDIKPGCTPKRLGLALDADDDLLNLIL